MPLSIPQPSWLAKHSIVESVPPFQYQPTHHIPVSHTMTPDHHHPLFIIQGQHTLRSAHALTTATAPEIPSSESSQQLTHMSYLQQNRKHTPRTQPTTATRTPLLTSGGGHGLGQGHPSSLLTAWCSSANVHWSQQPTCVSRCGYVHCACRHLHNRKQVAILHQHQGTLNWPNAREYVYPFPALAPKCCQRVTHPGKFMERKLNHGRHTCKVSYRKSTNSKANCQPNVMA
jgi:hypothetical protein